MKKVNICPDGGYVKLQHKLLSSKEVQCTACTTMLEDCKFEAEAFHDFVLKWVNGELSSIVEEGAVEALSNPAPDKPQDSNEGALDEEGGEPEDKRGAALAFLKTFEPMLTLLEPGQFGKNTPVRCNLCVSEKWKEGKVIECNVLRVGSLKHFIRQHFKCRQHLDALRGKKETPGDMVPCTGLCINDPVAQKLHQHRSEFKIWASLANFHECAKHSYWFDANEDSWIIRSHHCLKECPVKEATEHNTCEKCIQLGSAHGVARKSFRCVGTGFAFRGRLNLFASVFCSGCCWELVGASDVIPLIPFSWTFLDPSWLMSMHFWSPESHRSWFEGKS